MHEEIHEVDEIVEELVTEHKSVKDILKEMKNVSEVMVDLAYSAILFNDDQLAEVVEDLEEEMNKLRYQIEIRTMVSARTPKDAGHLAGILRVAGAAEQISNSANSMANIVLRDINLHPALQKALEEADEIVAKMNVGKTSRLAGKSVDQIRADEKHGFDIIGIKRNKNWKFKFEDSAKIKIGDVVIVSGFKENVEALKAKK